MSSVFRAVSLVAFTLWKASLMIPMHCRKDKGAFVNKPFINWRKLQEKAKRHEQMKYHHDAMIATESFLNSVENPEQNVHNRLHDEKRKDIIRKGPSLNMFQKPSFSLIDSALPCVEITKSLTLRVVGTQAAS